MSDVFTTDQWKFCQLKYILKAIKWQKEKFLASIFLLLPVKYRFFKNRDHVFNLLFCKQPEKHGTAEKGKEQENVPITLDYIV